MPRELEEQFESDRVRIAVLRQNFLMDAVNDSTLVDEMDFKSMLTASFNCKKLTTQLKQLSDF